MTCNNAQIRTFQVMEKKVPLDQIERVFYPLKNEMHPWYRNASRYWSNTYIASVIIFPWHLRHLSALVESRVCQIFLHLWLTLYQIYIIYSISIWSTRYLSRHIFSLVKNLHLWLTAFTLALIPSQTSSPIIWTA